MLTFEAIDAKWVGKLNLTVVAARAKIPGGWLVATKGGFLVTAGCARFVPDPNHEWNGSSLPVDQNGE